MSYTRRRMRFDDIESTSLLRTPAYFIMDTEGSQIIPCRNGGHACAMRTIRNKAVNSWTRWVACHCDRNGFQMLESYK